MNGNPNGNITYTVYNDGDDEVRTYAGWDSTTGRPTGPTSISRTDKAHGYSESLTISTAPSLDGSGRPTGQEAFATSDIQSLSRSYTNIAGQTYAGDDYYKWCKSGSLRLTADRR